MFTHALVAALGVMACTHDVAEVSPADVDVDLGPDPLVLYDTCVQPHDAEAWLGVLRRRRPDLFRDAGFDVRSDVWKAVVSKPGLHSALLTSKTSYANITHDQYALDDKMADAEWATGLRDFASLFLPEPGVRIAGYPPKVFFGLFIGEKAFSYDARGLVYKAFVQVDDSTSVLTPQRLAGFGRELHRRGFEGDFKVPLSLGQTRFQYNNIIVHAPTPAMAMCAEAVAIDYFEADILYVGRGIDVSAATLYEPWQMVLRRNKVHGTSWHQFLLMGGFSMLPNDVKDFVKYRSNLRDPCGRGLSGR